MQVMKRIYRPWYIRPRFKINKINLINIIRTGVQLFRKPRIKEQISPNQYREARYQHVEYLKIV